jgi:hypothetical protein
VYDRKTLSTYSQENDYGLKKIDPKIDHNKRETWIMQKLMICYSLALVLMIIMPGTAQSSDKSTIIGLMIDAQNPPGATEEQAALAQKNLENIYNKINQSGLVGTIFSTQDALNSSIDLRLTYIGAYSDFELGMSGVHSNENISTLSYADQKAALEKSKMWVEQAKICGQNNVIVYGFMPQSFNQNEDTYKVLDDIGIQYDTGYQAGLLYEPRHQNDVWPYLVEGHKFYAVPVSTYDLSGKKVVLQDSYFKDNGMSASQWYDAIASKFEQIQGKDEPMVISLNTSVSGSGDYLDALKKFMDYATVKNAKFVTTNQLVQMAKTGVRDVSALPAIEATSAANCPTCSQGSLDISATVTNTTAPCLTCGQNATNATAA